MTNKKFYLSPEASVESIATADVITLSLGMGVGTAGSVDLSKYFVTQSSLDMEDDFDH